MERKNMWKQYTTEQNSELESLCVRYRECLDAAKTERECVNLAIQMAVEKGYMNLDTCMKEGKKLSAGDKVYAECMGKALALFQIGTESLERGMNILGAHVDSPRMDIK